MKNRSSIALFILTLCSFLLVFDLFLHQGRPATYDGPTHITAIAQFHYSLKEGEFPVRWSSGYGNYGQPMPSFNQQVPAYVGALWMFVVEDPTTAYNLTVFTAALFSIVMTYMLLSQFASILPALIAAVFFNFGAYRILNLYVRGALPEFFAAGFVAMLAYFSLKLWRNPNRVNFIGVCLSYALLMLTHVFTAFLAMITIVLVGLAYKAYRRPSQLIFHLLGIIIALGISAYYIMPLLLESKYHYVGHETHQVSFISYERLFTESWPYVMENSHPGPRSNLVQFGLFETVILLASLLVLVSQPKILGKNKSHFARLLAVSGIVAVMTLPITGLIYDLVPYLSRIQYSYRWFSILAFFPAILLAMLLTKLRRRNLWIALVVVMISFRFTQAYGKNYYQVDPDVYKHNPATLHTQNLNTIWMSHWRDYPVKNAEAEIIDGDGSISIESIANTKKQYQITADTPVRVVDYTFYYPGWELSINDEPWDIEFQDPNYRGIITYKIPAGEHQVVLEFFDTKIRAIGNYISLISIGGLMLVTYYWQNIKRSLNKYLQNKFIV